jgi:hypothetical protein
VGYLCDFNYVGQLFGHVARKVSRGQAGVGRIRSSLGPTRILFGTQKRELQPSTAVLLPTVTSMPRTTYTSSRGAVPAPAPLANVVPIAAVSVEWKSSHLDSDRSLQISLSQQQRPRLMREGSSTTTASNVCPSLTGLSCGATTVTRSISANSDRSCETLNDCITPTKTSSLSTSLEGSESFLKTDTSLSPLTIDSRWGTSASLASHNDIIAVVAPPPLDLQDGASYPLDLPLQWDRDCDDDEEDEYSVTSAASSMAVAGDEHLHTSLLLTTTSGRSSSMTKSSLDETMMQWKDSVPPSSSSDGIVSTNESSSFPHSECRQRIPTWIQVSPMTTTTMISVPRPPLLPPACHAAKVDFGTLPGGLSPSLSVQDLSERLRASDATVTLLWHALQKERRRQQDQAQQWQVEERALLHQQANQACSFGNALMVAAVAAILALFWGCWEGFGALVGLVLLLFPAPLDHDD